MATSNIPPAANQSLMSSTLATAGRAAKIGGIGLVVGGFITGLPIMSIGTLLGAGGTALGLASQATSPQGLSLARAF